MRSVLTLLLLTSSVAACTGSGRSACGGYFPSCDRDAPRPPCRSLTPADSSVYATDIRGLVGRVPEDELASFFGSEGATDPFLSNVAEADAVWYYDASGYSPEMGMRIGEEGIIAVNGCTALAQMTLVLYN